MFHILRFLNLTTLGINNKIKMVKRVMYGRCKLPLLKAKLIGHRWDEVTSLTDFCG